ncbi:embryonic polarity protein dorsal-like [Anoplophora glabripennis]|uniref:embryonic polarity protein dorsal-like n=1 Tax=Anoplophora glabripennis TaxID=217634 RepID=UPI0008738435|nr:embryonic polarity protein dorsal-like [Anoplophora glabripennis]
MSRQVENKLEYLKQWTSNSVGFIATDREGKSQNKTMFVGGDDIAQQPPPALVRLPYVRIIEQPASKALRFRYECEGRCAGSIPGASSTPQKKTFPTIQIVGHRGRAMVVVSCVTKDTPHRPHPHNLVGKEGCKKGVCTLNVPTDTMTVHFSNLGIQCVKKKDIEQSLKIREEIRVDPFRTGFGHGSQPATIDLNSVRLCFQVFLEGNTPGKFSLPLPAVVSDPIFDKKAMSDLAIAELSDCVSYVDGGRKNIILLCEKVTKEDISVRFYENEGEWEAYVKPIRVHKQHAICFKPPKYRDLDVKEPVRVFIQLYRPSDGATSKPLPFELLPLESEPGVLKRKRQKMEDPILKSLQNVHSFSSPYNDFNPYGGVSPEYVSNLPHQNYTGPGPSQNNPNVLRPNTQSPIWNIPPSTNFVPQLLQGFDSQLNSDEVDATLKTMVEESSYLPDIKSLSLSDISPN